MASIFRRIFGGDKIEGTWVGADKTTTANILGYAGRQTDRKQIREAILRRYGTGIKIVKDPVTGITHQTYSKDGMSVRMQAGHIETVSVGLGHKIAGAIATQFSEQTQNFALTSPKGKNVKAASELLDRMRGGTFVESLVEADEDSVWVGCMPVFVEYVDGGLQYHPTDPGKIQVLFEEFIESDGFTRPTNHRKIEDATCVVIETGTHGSGVKSYVAIFGRSMQYPNGRYVTYRSSGDGRDVPEVYDANANDWTIDGEPANPLTWYANDRDLPDLPEYPVAIIHSGLVRRDTLFPVSQSLLSEALEADISASHIRATSGDNARGTKAFTKSDNAGTQPLPQSLSGEVTLEPGQKLEQVLADSNAPKIAWDLLQEGMVASGLGFTVPDFYLSSKDHTVEAASGAALRVRSGQLAKLRGRRVELNAPAVKKIFTIEKILIALMAPKETDAAAIELLESCEQTWDPGTPESPETEAEKVAAVKELVALGIYDTIEAIRVVYNLGSESEAIEKYQQLAKRAKQYPPLNAAQNSDADTDTGKGTDTDTDTDEDKKRGGGTDEPGK